MKSIAKQLVWLIPITLILLILEFKVLYRWWFVETSILPICEALFLIVAIYLAVREINSLTKPSIARGVLSGIALSLLLGLLSGGFSAYYTGFIDRDFRLRLIAVNEDDLRREGKKDYEIKLASKATYITYSPIPLFFTTLLFYVAIGCIASFGSFFITARK